MTFRTNQPHMRPVSLPQPSANSSPRASSSGGSFSHNSHHVSRKSPVKVEQPAGPSAYPYEQPGAARAHKATPAPAYDARAPEPPSVPAATPAAATAAPAGYVTREALDIAAEELSAKKVEALLSARADTKDLARRETLLQLAGSSKVGQNRMPAGQRRRACV